MDRGKIKLRDATPDDIEEIADIWRHYVSNSIANLEETPPGTAEMRQTLYHILDSAYPFLVAEEGTIICGYAYAGPFNDRSGYKFCCEDTIYLLPSCAGKGLGRHMLETLMKRLKADTKNTQVLAKISLPPEATLRDVPSCRLHLSAGFYEAGRLKKVGRKFDQWLDVVILQHDLEDVA